MKILIVNDDGIEAEGLRHLVEWARPKGELFVCAPRAQQSGTSQSIVYIHGFEVLPYTLPYAPEVSAWRVDSTPADCVRIAYLLLGLRPDLVLSGINKGYNLGTDINYSGTCGALFEAEGEGAAGLALSADPRSFEGVGESLDRVWDFLTGHGIPGKSLLEPASLYNVNIPPNPAAQICLTRQGGSYARHRFVPAPEAGPHIYEVHGHDDLPNRGDLSLDIDALRSGYISVTPLTANRTDEALYRHALSKLSSSAKEDDRA